MRQFAKSGSRLWNLSSEAKLIYSCFCVLSIFAMLSSLLLYEDLVGPSLSGASGSSLKRVKAYYSSDAAPTEQAAPAPPAPTAPSTPESGPAIALPADDPTVAEATPTVPAGRATALTITVPYRKLLEVTHFHLFTVPVFLLILTHLFLLTGMGSRAKLWWIAFGWGAGTLHMAAPWLIRLFGGGLGFLFPLSGFWFLAASLMLTVYPMVVMWRRPSRRRGDKDHRGRGNERLRSAASPTPGPGHEAHAAHDAHEAHDRPETSDADAPGRGGEGTRRD